MYFFVVKILLINSLAIYKICVFWLIKYKKAGTAGEKKNAKTIIKKLLFFLNKIVLLINLS
jgi:hypothetical protein